VKLITKCNASTNGDVVASQALVAVPPGGGWLDGIFAQDSVGTAVASLILQDSWLDVIPLALSMAAAYATSGLALQVPSPKPESIRHLVPRGQRRAYRALMASKSSRDLPRLKDEALTAARRYLEEGRPRERVE